MNAPLNPDQWADMQVQEALAVLNEHNARIWLAGEEARRAKAEQEVADWRKLEQNSVIRAREYEATAKDYPAAHRNHRHYRKLALDQWGLVAKARQYAEIAMERL